jgi:hypothetical protein
MIFYDLAYKVASLLAQKKEPPHDHNNPPAAIGIKGKVTNMTMDDVSVKGMRLMDVDKDAQLKDVKIKSVTVALLPPPQQAPFWLKILVDSTGSVASVITIMPVVRLIIDSLR